MSFFAPKSVVFQPLTWTFSDRDVVFSQPNDCNNEHSGVSFSDSFSKINCNSKKSSSKKVVVISCRGRDNFGTIYCLNINDFRPYFHIKFYEEEEWALTMMAENENWDCVYFHKQPDCMKSMYNFFPVDDAIDDLNKNPSERFEKNKAFFRVSCSSITLFYRVRKYFIENKIPTFDSQLGFIEQFMIEADIKPMTWISLNEFQLVKRTHFSASAVPSLVSSQPNIIPDFGKNGSSEVWEIEANLSSISSVFQLEFAPFKCGFYDLECFSSRAYQEKTDKMPDPSNPQDVIIGIGIVISTVGNLTTPAFDRIEQHYFGIMEKNREQQHDELDADSLSPKHLQSCSSNIYWFDNERLLLQAFVEFCSISDFDFWIGFNNHGFDDNYLSTRFELNKTDLFNHQSTFPNFFRGAFVETIKFNSSAFQNEAIAWKFSTRVNLDLLTFARKEWKNLLSRFSLNSIASVFLDGEQKDDVTPKDIFRAYAENDVVLLFKVAHYCIQDCMLLLKLCQKKAILTTLFSRAELFDVGVSSINTVGQTKIVFNLINRRVRGQSHFLPDRISNHSRTKTDGWNNNSFQEEESTSGLGGKSRQQFSSSTPPEHSFNVGVGYTGATVFDPDRGFHKDPVAALDFASLYPSIMRAFNMCHSTWCGNDIFVRSRQSDKCSSEAMERHELMISAMNACIEPGHDFMTSQETFRFFPDDGFIAVKMSGARENNNCVAQNGLKPENSSSSPRVHFFAHHQTCPGILPAILSDLTQKRSEFKNHAKIHKANANIASIYDARQIAVKLASNSIYGFCGAQFSQLPQKEIAETVCTVGRQLISKCRDFVHIVDSTLFSRQNSSSSSSSSSSIHTFSHFSIDHVEKTCRMLSEFACEFSSLRVVYGDTDSVYVKFVDFRSSPERLFILAQTLNDCINSFLPLFIVLEFERIMHPLMLLVKKRYAFYNVTSSQQMKNEMSVELGNDNNTGRDEKNIVIKGMAAVRRDFAPILKSLTKSVLKKLFCDNDVDGAFQIAVMTVKNILSGKIPKDQFIISKSISKPLDEYANQSTAHVALAQKAVITGEKNFSVGSRVEYVFVKKQLIGPPSKKSKQLKRKQKDFVDFPENDESQLDYGYYIRHQIITTLRELLELADPQKWKVFNIQVESLLTKNRLMTDYFHSNS
jgi:DNA polymerase elongation subunit (family B)